MVGRCVWPLASLRRSAESVLTRAWAPRQGRRVRPGGEVRRHRVGAKVEDGDIVIRAAGDKDFGGHAWDEGTPDFSKLRGNLTWAVSLLSCRFGGF